MSSPTEHSRYSSVAIWLHWIIAVIVFGNLIGGLTVEYFFDSPDPAMKAAGSIIIGLHKSLGLTVIVLTLARLAWRIANPPPPLPTHMTPLEVVLARGTHSLFYGLLLAIPLSGWAMVSTAKELHPIKWFWLFQVPMLPLSRNLNAVFDSSHMLLGYLAIATILLHIAGALKHHYLDRDDVLARMLPLVRPKAG